MLIHTPNLRLLSCDLAHLEAIVRGPRSLGELLNVSIPPNWPAHPQAYPHALDLLRLEPSRALSGWWLYLFLLAEERTLIGCGGFKGPPDALGDVELGFEIAPAHRKRGLDAEAVRGLIRYAFTRPATQSVSALTLPDGDPRARVLRAAGLRAAGSERDAQAGPVTRWRITRNAFEDLLRKAA